MAAPARKASQNSSQAKGEDQVDWLGAQGMHPDILEVKQKWNSTTKWGRLYAKLSKCGKVL